MPMRCAGIAQWLQFMRLAGEPLGRWLLDRT